MSGKMKSLGLEKVEWKKRLKEFAICLGSWTGVLFAMKKSGLLLLEVRERR